MQFSISDDTLKIDNKNSFYSGQVSMDMFPEEIKENYLEIIQQSFDDFIDDKYSVTKNFDDKTKYIINFSYKVKPFSFKRQIIIPVDYHMKDYQDYTNERIEKLEKIIDTMAKEIQSLKLSKLIDDDKDSDNDQKEDNTEEEEEDDVEIKVPITKGGKTVGVAVQMKNGRQVVKNR